eukprot:2076083-Amphidinium_carterae.1
MVRACRVACGLPGVEMCHNTAILHLFLFLHSGLLGSSPWTSALSETHSFTTNTTPVFVLRLQQPACNALPLVMFAATVTAGLPETAEVALT